MKQTINFGTGPNTGDTIAAAFDKTQDNVDELFSVASPATSITYDGSQRVATFVKDGVTYNCTYYVGGSADEKLHTIVGGGVTRTFLYNVSGLLTDEIIT